MQTLARMAIPAFPLTELEDLTLAACEGQYLEASSSRAILSQWLERPVPYSELRLALRRLQSFGLLRTYVKLQGRIVRAELQGCPTHALLKRGTSEARAYLQRPRRSVTAASNAG